jgi:hypothetical protein
LREAALARFCRFGVQGAWFGALKGAGARRCVGLRLGRVRVRVAGADRRVPWHRKRASVEMVHVNRTAILAWMPSYCPRGILR